MVAEFGIIQEFNVLWVSHRQRWHDSMNVIRTNLPNNAKECIDIHFYIIHNYVYIKLVTNGIIHT